MVDNEALRLVNKMLLDSLQSLPRHPYHPALGPGFVGMTNDTTVSTVSRFTPVRIEEIAYYKNKTGKSKLDRYVCT